MLQNLVVEYEKLNDPKLPACSRKTGHLLETCCTIMDCKGVSILSAKSVYNYLQGASSILQNYYPERLGKLYIINAPWGFSSVFAVVKRFLDPVTVAKIMVLGGGYESELLAQVPKENLPKYFGGECECDEGCMFSDIGPWTDPQWTKTPKWQKDKDEQAAETENEEVKATDTSVDVEETGQAASGAGTKVEEDKQGATDKAPAAA